MSIKIELLDQENQVKCGVMSYEETIRPYQVMGDEMAVLGIKKLAWAVGDKIRISTSMPHQYLWVQLDETLAPTMIYLIGTSWTYTIQPTKNKIDTVYAAKRHCIMVRKATTTMINQYQNLAFNAYDQLIDAGAFPHALTNVVEETNPVFMPQNAIDGKLANLSHGSYPFGSWGTHQRSDASLTIDFGRMVEVNSVKLLLRRDQLERPHDGYWQTGQLSFDNGAIIDLELTDSEEFQSFSFPSHRTTKVVLKNLMKAENSAKFTALSQIEVYGYNCA